MKQERSSKLLSLSGVLKNLGDETYLRIVENSGHTQRGGTVNVDCLVFTSQCKPSLRGISISKGELSNIC